MKQNTLLIAGCTAVILAVCYLTLAWTTGANELRNSKELSVFTEKVGKLETGCRWIQVEEPTAVEFRGRNIAATVKTEKLVCTSDVLTKELRQVLKTTGLDDDTKCHRWFQRVVVGNEVNTLMIDLCWPFNHETNKKPPTRIANAN